MEKLEGVDGLPTVLSSPDLEGSHGSCAYSSETCQSLERSACRLKLESVTQATATLFPVYKVQSMTPFL